MFALNCLSEIAIALGYRRLKQTDIDRYYAPQVLSDQATMQGDIQKEFLQVLRDTKSLPIDPKK